MHDAIEAAEQYGCWNTELRECTITEYQHEDQQLHCVDTSVALNNNVRPPSRVVLNNGDVHGICVVSV